jgi:hypothetical protein
MTDPTAVRCPGCGSQADVQVRRSAADPVRPEIESFECPQGCAVDPESIRQIIGTSNA